MPKPKKRGRPALPPDEVKRVFPVRLSAAEIAKFKAAAKRDDAESVSEWIRDTLTAKADGKLRG